MATALAAQGAITVGPGRIMGPRQDFGYAMNGADAPRAVIGVSTTSAATSRDTLGVLVSTITSGSPADKAGIEEGNRIASINGVSLKLAAADIGDNEMAGALSRRLNRELDKLKPGDEVDLQVYANGQTKTVKVKTIAPSDLYASARRRIDDRPTLGLEVSSTGNSRDTIGVFVMSADDGGPAAKAGIEEGSRIASINGVDVRGTRSTNDDDVWIYHSSTLNRFEREVSNLKPGESAELRVYYNGQFKNVKVTVGRMSDLPNHARRMTIIGGDGAFPGIEARIDGREIGEQIRNSMATVRTATGSALEGLSRAFGRFGNRVEW
ncbi:MAG TPA: PDZ domain-containing protein [Gemmatimonadaceae bacterium]|nr:PDZ domain-containing protein [Gemmatimonadaceae bacterium]